MLGFVVTICSGIRIRYIFPVRNTTNPTWDYSRLAAWTEMEVHLSLVSCNLPPLAGLVRRLRRPSQHLTTFGSSEGTSTTGSSGRKLPRLNRIPTPTDPESFHAVEDEHLCEDEHGRIVMRSSQLTSPTDSALSRDTMWH
jgi:hypothetical protein